MALIPYDPDCVFYDSDLKALSRAFSDMHKVFKKIEKRAERRESVRISKSYFDYVDKRHALKVVPQTFFDFRLDDVRIMIYRYRRDYGVLCIGCDYPHDIPYPEYIGIGKLYGWFDKYEKAIPLFMDIVRYVLEILKIRYESDRIPF